MGNNYGTLDFKNGEKYEGYIETIETDRGQMKRIMCGSDKETQYYQCILKFEKGMYQGPVSLKGSKDMEIGNGTFYSDDNIKYLIKRDINNNGSISYTIEDSELIEITYKKNIQTNINIKLDNQFTFKGTIIAMNDFKETLNEIFDNIRDPFEITGEGTYISFNGDEEIHQIGYFKNSELSGEGTEIRYEKKDGELIEKWKYDGHFVDDIANGYGIVYENGKIWEGTFIQNKRNGDFLYIESGKRYYHKYLYNTLIDYKYLGLA